MVVPLLFVAIFVIARLVAGREPLPDEPAVLAPARPGVPLDDLLGAAAPAGLVVRDVTIGEVVAVDDELLAAWSGDGQEGVLHLHLPWPVARRQAIDTLAWWQLSGRPLTAFASPSHALAGLADEQTGTVYTRTL